MRLRALAAALVLLTAALADRAAAAEETFWLALSIATTDRTLAAEAAAIREGRRRGLVAHADYDRHYPVPGFVPVDPRALRRGITLDAVDGPLAVLTLRQAEDGTFLLFDRGKALVAVPEPTGEMPVIALPIPLELVRPALRQEKGETAADVAARRGRMFVPPLRVASAGGSLARAIRSHEEGHRRRQMAPLGAPILIFRPGVGFMPDAASGPPVLPVGLGTDLGARWLFSSTPAGATVAFEGLADPVATEVGVRNLPASAMRTMVMRKEGYRDCRHADARLEVVVRGGLEWNRVHCRLAAAGG